MLYAIVAVLSIILDQWVKYWTASNLEYGGPAKELIPGVVELLNVHNDGAAFSFLSGANAGNLFIILAVVFSVLVVIGLITNFISGKLARWSAVLVAAGGIGNAIDRALYSYVQDMFHLTFLENFPVFNVADIFITVFCLLFILCIIFGGKDRSDSEEDIDYYEEEFEDVPKVRSNRSSRGRDSYGDEEEEAPSRRRRQADEYEEEERPSRRAAKADAYDEEPAPRQRRRSVRADDFESGDDSAYSSGYDSGRVRSRRRDAEFEEAFAPKQSSRAAERKSVPDQPAPRRRQEPVDPFSEWDKQNSAAGYGRENSDYSYGSQSAAPAPVAPKPAPVQTERPAAPKRASSDDFDLDDILAEFK